MDRRQWRACDAGLGELTKDYCVQCLSFPQSVRSATLRVGVAIGAWNTLSTCDRNGVSGSPPDLTSGSWFPKPVETADGSVIANVANSITDQQVRIIAIDATGKEHVKAWGSGISTLKEYRQLTATFRGVSLEQIREFRFQARPYHWVEFRNVSLQPGQKTDVRVVVDSAPSKAGNDVARLKLQAAELQLKQAEAQYQRRSGYRQGV